MCFSATASFAVAGATAVSGIACLRAAATPQDYPMAAVPLLFAVQQAIEGALWLQLDGGAGADHVAALSQAFLIFAEVIWPVLIPLAVLAIEPGRGRRRVMTGVAVLGIALGAFMLSRILGAPNGARIAGHSIRYTGDDALVAWTLVPYVLCTCAVLFLSSHRRIRVFAAIVAVGFAVSAWAHFATLISVWCFFAAAASTVLYLHFRAEAAQPRVATVEEPVRLRTD